MEIVIACFIGAWLSAAGLLAYREMKREFKDLDGKKGREGR